MLFPRAPMPRTLRCDAGWLRKVVASAGQGEDPGCWFGRRAGVLSLLNVSSKQEEILVPLRRRRTHLPASTGVLARKLSRERIIPIPRALETSGLHVMILVLRGSLLTIMISLPLLAVPGFLSPRTLPYMALFLTASHGSVLVRRWVRLR